MTDYAHILKAAQSLPPDDIRQLITDLQTCLDTPPPTVEPPAFSANGAPPTPPGAWYEVKTIKGRDYRYMRWREGGKLKSRYIGKVREQ